MSNSRRRSLRWSWLLSVLAAVGLGLATAPAQAAPPALSQDRFADFPALPLDPSAMVAQVGPQVVNINTKLGYNNAVGAGTGIVIDPNGVVLTNNHVIAGAPTSMRSASAPAKPTASMWSGMTAPRMSRCCSCAVPVACRRRRSVAASRLVSPSSRWATAVGRAERPVRCLAGWSRSAKPCRRRIR
ncbi:serine protease [Mycobacterium tuberculosis]|nr:serine protease [Mycobacterium tuberculosis]